MYEVETLVELEETALQTVLNRLEQSGRSIDEVVPHRIGQAVGADIITTEAIANRFEWEVHRAAGYGQPLADVLNQLTAAGWQKFAIIPHRVRQDNFPEVIVRRPLSAGQ